MHLKHVAYAAQSNMISVPLPKEATVLPEHLPGDSCSESESDYTPYNSDSSGELSCLCLQSYSGRHKCQVTWRN